MAENVTKRSHIHPFFRVVLVFLLILCGGMLIASINWIFHKVHYSLGMELAEVTVAIISIFILILILVGLRTGLSMDRFLRRRRYEACRIYQTFRQVRYFLSWLGYEDLQTEHQAVTGVENQSPEEVLALIDRPIRRGRTPTYSLDRWTKVVLAWEGRDTWRNPITLSEFLAEEFGTYADGSPRISDSRFYEIRKIILKDLRKKMDQKKAPR